MVGNGDLLKRSLRRSINWASLNISFSLVCQIALETGGEYGCILLTSRIEGLPNVIIEAQGFGLPVVSTDAGGAEEVIVPDISGLIRNKIMFQKSLDYC